MHVCVNDRASPWSTKGILWNIPMRLVVLTAIPDSCRWSSVCIKCRDFCLREVVRASDLVSFLHLRLFSMFSESSLGQSIGKPPQTRVRPTQAKSLAASSCSLMHNAWKYPWLVARHGQKSLLHGRRRHCRRRPRARMLSAQRSLWV